MAGARPVVARPADCAYCGMCEDMCPEGAIALEYEIVSGPAQDRESSDF
jgi:NAD-dependent dihydropyrimidine dehydrogenase PreA subunit